MTVEQENKRLRELLRDCRMIVREVGYPKLAASIDAALSQQAEPTPAQTEQQPIGWITEDYLTDKSATTYSPEVADRWRAKGWPVSEIYAAPIAQTALQPEQEQDDSLNMEPEGANAYLVVDPDDNYHICYVVRSKDQALQHATDGLLAFGPITLGGNS